MPLKFSIITPSLNQGRFIRDNIESVLAQKYELMEHIIIDGGSSDNTLKILSEYKHLIWKSEKDLGPADAINKGLRIATGDIVAWINSDDFYEIGIFDIINNIFENKKFEIVIGNLTFVDEKK